MASQKHYVKAAQSLNFALQRADSQDEAHGLLEGARIIAGVFASESGNKFNRQRFFNAVTEDTDYEL
jgi:hypothetical protein